MRFQEEHYDMTLGIPSLSSGPEHTFGGTGAQCTLVDGHNPDLGCPAGAMDSTDGHHGLSFLGILEWRRSRHDRVPKSGRSDTGGCPDWPFLDAGSAAGKALTLRSDNGLVFTSRRLVVSVQRPGLQQNFSNRTRPSRMA